MKYKKLLTAMTAIAIVTSIGFTFDPLQKTIPANAVATTTTMPAIQWHSLKGITLNPGQFLDLADTTPVFTTQGHSALYLPCDSTTGATAVTFLQGHVDVGINTLEPVPLEWLAPNAPSPTPGIPVTSGNCLYHGNIGTASASIQANKANGVTDFAIINTGSSPITFGDRHTITFTFAQGFKKFGAE